LPSAEQLLLKLPGQAAEDERMPPAPRGNFVLLSLKALALGSRRVG